MIPMLIFEAGTGNILDTCEDQKEGLQCFTC